MTKENEYLKSLAAARKTLIADRRKFAAALAEPSRRDEMRDQFISTQRTIEAIDIAIADEQKLASDEKPASFVKPMEF